MTAATLSIRTSTFRESVKASDKLLEYLERFDWTRRPDLEEVVP